MISDRVSRLAESATIKMSQLSRDLRAQGVEVLNLSVGEPDFPTPAHVKAAGKNAIDDNYTHYTPISGSLELRKAISLKLKHDNNLDYDWSQIVVSTGAKQAIMNVVLALVNPGDEVVIPTPYWVSYPEIVKLAEGKIVLLPSRFEKQFKITPEELASSITVKTKLFIFSSPCNPTGSIYSKQELAELVKVFEQHPQVFILSDEIYEHINFTGGVTSIAQFTSIKDRVIIINGVSKAFAMTGWRIGYSVSNKQIATACDKIQGQTTSGTCSIAQHAAIAAYKGDLEEVIKMKNIFCKRRDLVYKMLTDIKGIRVHVPDGAFYFFPNVSHFFSKKDASGKLIHNASNLSLYLLETAHVAVVEGSAFGDDQSIRISYAASEEVLIKALTKIKLALAALKY